MNTVEESKKEQLWFATHHLKDDLKTRSVKGGASTVGGQLISFGMTISSTIIMARLLSPEDYGLVAMVTAFTGFVSIFKDLGLSAAVIQKEYINQHQVSTLFWINIMISLSIALIIAFLAPLLVSFYREDRLFYITIAFSISIFITGFSMQHSALMNRQMKFKALSGIQIVSTAASLCTGVLLAWYGYGYWAIVATTVLTPVFSTIILWIVCDWRPNLIVRSSNIRSFVEFGAGITGFDLVNYFSRNMDNILIGRYVGSGALGVYSKAYQLLMLPITQLRNPLNAVALPALSSLQKDEEKYQIFFKRYLFTLAFFSMPIVMYLGIFSDEIILLVLGNQWSESGYIFKLLAITAFIQPVASTQGLVLITTGNVKKYFNIGCTNAIITITGFALGVNWGIIGVAISYAVVNYLMFIPSLFYSFKNSPISLSLFLREVTYPFIFSLLSGIVMFFFKINTSIDSFYTLCVLGFIIGLLTYIVLWKSSRSSNNQYLQILSFIALLRKK